MAWSELTSPIIPLLRDDIDTDVIIPQTELVVTTTDGLAGGLFAGWRYDERRAPVPEFALNQPRYRHAQILAAGRNFGCGSSREHAVWALAEYGIRCLLAPSYGAIFYRNCLRSQIAPLTIGAPDLAELLAQVDGPRPSPVTVDLLAGEVAAGGRAWRVGAPDEIRRYVVEGLDEVGVTLRLLPRIEQFERAWGADPVGRLSGQRGKG